jgi:DNA repair protein RadC
MRDAAAAVIFVHNHPSGDATPSREDLEITRRLREVGEIVGVRVLDHIVIGKGRYVSFVDDGYW